MNPPIHPLEQQLIEPGLLTAFVQVPPTTTRQLFLEHPEVASMAAATYHLKFAANNGIKVVELAAAHSMRNAHADPDKMPDPPAMHVNMETPSSGKGRDLSPGDADILVEACEGKTRIGTLGVFEDLLHHDPSVRAQNQEHVKRAIRAAALIKYKSGTDVGVTIFIGRDANRSIEENLRLFATEIIPLIRYAKKGGIVLFLENCPMVGWSDKHDLFVQNIGNVLAHWILFARMLKKTDLKGWFVLNFDPSHEILQFLRPEDTFLMMAYLELEWLMGRYHGKDLVRTDGLVCLVGSSGLRIGNGWNKMNGDQPPPGATRYDARAIADGKQVDWFNLLFGDRKHLKRAGNQRVFTTEFELGAFRNAGMFQDQDHQWHVCSNIMLGSAGFVQGMDLAAAHHHALEQMVLAKQPAHGEVKEWSGVWNFHLPHCNADKRRVEDLLASGAQKVLNLLDAWELPEIPADTGE